tara:strand:+ start:551 stop:1126 length:576 start_codon:yes stop_codon:yes gene_type:complete
MKSFQQFIAEARTYDPDVQGRSSISNRGDDGRVGPNRKKTEPEKRRMKAGTNTPVKDYKPRKDIGKQRHRSEREQQPEKERGTAGLDRKAAQKKAYLERKAKERGEKTKSATELLTKKKKKKVDPRYKPTGGPGNTGTSKRSYTAKERKALTKAGERKLRDLRLKTTGKSKESELDHAITQQEITRRNKKK